MRWSRFNAWFEHVPVGERIAAAKKRAAKRAKAFGRQPEPVAITGRDIAKKDCPANGTSATMPAGISELMGGW